MHLTTAVEILQSVGGTCSFVVGLVFAVRVLKWNRAEIRYWRRNEEAAKGLIDGAVGGRGTKPVACFCMWSGDPLELQVFMLAATASAQGFFTALFALWTLVAGDPENGTFRCDAQAGFRNFAWLASVLYSVTPPVFAILMNADRIPCSSWRSARPERWSRRSVVVAAGCGFIALLLAIIPQAAGVIGVDHAECWINTSLDKDDVLEWQIIVFQGWLVLAWVVASAAMLWMLSNVTPVTGGWRQKILAFSLPVVIVYGVGLFRRFWAWATPGVGSPAALAALDSSLSPLMGAILPFFYRTYWGRSPREEEQEEGHSFVNVGSWPGSQRPLSTSDDAWDALHIPLHIPQSATVAAAR